MRKIIYALYLALFEMPIAFTYLAGITGVGHWISNYERNQIIELVEKRNEAISMRIMPEQIQEKEQNSWISK
jgi:hypothetical protein